MAHTPRRRIRPRWAAVAVLLWVSLTITACQVEGSASADADAVASVLSARAASSAATAPTRAPSTAVPTTPAPTGGTAPGTIEDRSTSVPPPGSAPTGTDPSAGNPGTTGRSTVVLADDGYPVSVLVTTLWARALAMSSTGTTVVTRTIDQTADQLSALESGQVALVQQYNGSLLDFLDSKADPVGSADTDAAIAAKLPAGLTALASTPARDGAQLTVSAATASKYQLHSIADLGRHLPQITLLLPGTDGSADFTKGLSDYYGLTFSKTKAADVGGATTIAAITSSASVGVLNASQYQIDDAKLVALTDPEHLFFLENFIPVTTSKVTPAMRSTINAVSAKLTVTAVRSLRKKVADGQETVSQIADAWLASVGLK